MKHYGDQIRQKEREKQINHEHSEPEHFEHAEQDQYILHIYLLLYTYIYK